MWPQGHPRTPYPSAVTDQPWAILEPLMPPARTQRGGCPREVDRRAVINPLWYQHRRGGQGDLRPHDLRPTSTVDDSVAQWRDDGTWAPRGAAWRPQSRGHAGREPTPSAVCLASQAVTTTEMGGAERGSDGGKQITGRTRHLLVDTRGLLVALWLTGAGVDDGVAAPRRLAQLSPDHCPRLVILVGDRTDHTHPLHAWMAAHRPDWRLAVKPRPEGSTGVTPLEKRGVVERTNAWNGRSRRNRQDDERTPPSRTAMIHMRHLHLMRNRLAPRHCPTFHYRKAAA
jgi:putative transposase